jgi:glucose-induced degradation protein 8
LVDIDCFFQILDTNSSLYFHLQQQRLIEHIRHGRIVEALTFAQSELAPRGEENPEFLPELERTMALLAFDSLPGAPPAISELLAPAQRLRTAGELNAAILESLSQGKEAKLTALIRLMAWGESMLAKEDVDFPRVDLCSGLTVAKSRDSETEPSQAMDVQ